jgi:hypothetical protein
MYNDCDAIFLIDDDCSGIFVWKNQKKYKLNAEELQEFVEMNTLLCKEWGYYYWGFNCVGDKGAYREHTPFGTLQYIGSPAGVHIKSHIRYDENLSLKEDYDYTLQHIKEFKGCLRLNYAFYIVKQAEQTGGCAVYRNNDRGKYQFEILQKKWGSTIIKYDNSSKRKFDFNPILKIPIKGV